jgi:DNA-binding CsgD family transcriptional regulator
MDDLNLPEVTGALGVSTSDTRDGMAEHFIGSLARLAHELYGQADEVGERFCRAVTAHSRGCARLLLWEQRAERVALATSPAVRLKLPVECRGITYGELFVAFEPRNPTHPALSYETGARLAKACGELLHVLEEGALLNCLAQRIDLTLATKSLSRSQLDVLRHMAMGEDKEAIARALGVTVATVETHRCAIYARLGVHGPLEAVLAGHRLGLYLLIGSPSPSAIPARRQKRGRQTNT